MSQVDVARSVGNTDDPDDLRAGLDAGSGRDLLQPRPIDLPFVVNLGGSVDADAEEWVEAKIFAAPADAADWPRWRERLTQWRAQVALRPGRPRQEWAARCRTVFLAWLWDERLYDHERGEFTPDRLLQELTGQFGGIDAVVLWHAYPVIGLDDRNQFDYYDVPGLGALVADLQRRGVRVFLDYNPWDTATRRPDGDDASELAALVDRLGADGLFLDTLREAGSAIVDGLDPDVALEGESRISVAAMATHQLSWAQWFADSEVPGVMRAHWLDRRHMQHHTRRWNRDHSDELHSAWLNGCGVLLWDAVFGAWVGWNARDLAEHRFLRAVQIGFSDLLVEAHWTPLPDLGRAAREAGVYGARFSLGGRALYLLVNRGDVAVSAELDLDASDSSVDAVAWDLRGGTQAALDDGRAHLTVVLPGRGLGAVVLGPADDAVVARIASKAVGCTPEPDSRFPARPARRIPGPPSATGADRPGAGALPLPAGTSTVDLRYRRRESGLLDGAWWVDAWKPLPPDLHAGMIQTAAVAVAPGVVVRTAPVTRSEFAAFARATGYRPAIGHRYDDPLRVSYELGDPTAPATGVTTADAEAFAGWAGARLPRAAEWLLATQLSASKPQALEPLWLLTADVWREGPTRFVLLVGGGGGYPQGSPWYFDAGVPLPGWVAKLLIAGQGMTRSPALGFSLAWGPESAVSLGPARIESPGPPVPPPTEPMASHSPASQSPAAPSLAAPSSGRGGR